MKLVRLRLVLLALVAALMRAFALPLVSVPTAHAQVTTINIPCVVNGTATTCQLTNPTFVVRQGQLFLQGTLTAAGQNLGTVLVPVTGIRFPGQPCTILQLELGPLHLELLGVIVDLNRVVLTIRGDGGLGGLLCDILDALGNPGRLANLLNQLFRQLPITVLP